VRGALGKIDGMTEINPDIKSKVFSFQALGETDVDKMLTGLLNPGNIRSKTGLETDHRVSQ
jgi:hypothetical protein